MKRRIFCATATLVASIGFSGTAAAQTKWDFATAYAAHNFHSKNNEQFVKDVDAATKANSRSRRTLARRCSRCRKSSAPYKLAMRRWASSFW